MNYKLTSIQVAGNKYANDAKAMLDLLNEHCKKSVAMTFTRARGGRANLRHTHFTMPEHTINGKFPIEYTLYYVIHEFTHCLGYSEHGSEFKRHERQLLDIFGIKIEYARAYPKALYANGQRVYTKK